MTHNYQKGDIVQIIDENHHWYTALVIVSEAKSWGIQGYIPIPKGDNIYPAYIRLETHEICFTGVAKYIINKE